MGKGLGLLPNRALAAKKTAKTIGLLPNDQVLAITTGPVVEIGGFLALIT